MLVLYPLIYSFIFPYHCHIVCHMIPLSLPYFPFMIPLYSLSIASGWWYTYPSEKYIRSSVGMMTFPTEWKVIKFHGSKPPISIVSLNMVYIYIYTPKCVHSMKTGWWLPPVRTSIVRVTDGVKKSKLPEVIGMPRKLVISGQTWG
jgi:hypothetical protein